MYSISKLWPTRNLSIESKISSVIILAVSKLVYLALLLVISNHFMDGIAKIQIFFICDDSSPKIKHETLRMDFKSEVFKKIWYTSDVYQSSVFLAY